MALDVVTIAMDEGLKNNTYVVAEEGKALVIDPSFSAHRVQAVVAELKVKPVAILLTHGHYDHMGGAAALAKLYGVSVFMSRKDEVMFEKNLLSQWRDFTDQKHVKYFDDELDVPGFTVAVIPAPGHSPGSVLYQVGKYLFTGDAVLVRFVGLTNLPYSDPLAMRQTAKTFMDLPDDLIVMPGHYETGVPITEVKEKNEGLAAVLKAAP